MTSTPIMGRLAVCAAAVLAVGLSLCEAAPRVDIRIVPRPRPESETPVVGPVPYRPPMDPTGPFASYADSVGCMTNFETEIEGKSVLIDICHLKNVTFLEIPAPVSDAAETAQAEVESAAPVEGEKVIPRGGEPAATDATPSTDETATPPLARRQILGIFRGWKLDPIYKKFKYAVFDDGDICGEYGTERFSVTVELVLATQPDATPRVFDVRKVSSCSYALRVEAYVAEYELFASSGIHTPGVLDIGDADEILPQICGEMKCQYSHVAGRIDAVKEEIESLMKCLQEMVSSDSTSVASLSVSAASSIIKSSTDIMEKSLEVLQSIEQLEQAAQDALATKSSVAPSQISEVAATS